MLRFGSLRDVPGAVLYRNVFPLLTVVWNRNWYDTSATASPLVSTLTAYNTSSPNREKFGPPCGASNGIQLAISVTVFGLSGLTNAYVSVLSATGSWLISGASRWLEAFAPTRLPSATAAPATSTTSALGRNLRLVRMVPPSSGCSTGAMARATPRTVPGAYLPAPGDAASTPTTSQLSPTGAVMTLSWTGDDIGTTRAQRPTSGPNAASNGS